MTTPATTKPLFRVVKGNPTDTEIAALTAVLTGLASRHASQSPTAERNLWGRPEQRLQRPTLYNPSAFRNVNFY